MPVGDAMCRLTVHQPLPDDPEHAVVSTDTAHGVPLDCIRTVAGLQFHASPGINAMRIGSYCFTDYRMATPAQIVDVEDAVLNAVVQRAGRR